MRTTITLADDVVTAVEAVRRERSLGLSEAVNELVRSGLAAGSTAPPRFRQETHDLGAGIDFSNVGEALDLLDGPGSR
jgi:hypothetical protein